MNTKNKIIPIVIVIIGVLGIVLHFVLIQKASEVSKLAQGDTTFNATYIHPLDWPPQVTINDGPFTCTQAGNEIAPAGMTVERSINGKKYCVTTETEGAAGSIYTNYAYATSVGDKVIILTFGTRSAQCDNYDEPQKSACAAERASFDLDSIVDAFAQTVVVK